MKHLGRYETLQNLRGTLGDGKAYLCYDLKEKTVYIGIKSYYDILIVSGNSYEIIPIGTHKKKNLQVYKRCDSHLSVIYPFTTMFELNDNEILKHIVVNSL